MFQKGDLIIYGNTGVCRVAEIGTRQNHPEVYPNKLYYTLMPIYENSVIYTPIDCPVFMRPIITRAYANHLITMIPQIKENILETKDIKLLSEHYQSSIEKHMCEDLLQVVKTVYVKNQNYASHGRKLGQTDQKFMKKAEDLLFREFAVALDIPCDMVRSYIEHTILDMQDNDFV